MRERFSLLLSGLLLVAPLPLSGQPLSSNFQPELLRSVRFEQELGAQVPLDLSFRDDSGAPVRLGSFFGQRPVVLTLAYYECPMLCTQVLNGLTRSLRALSFAPGQEFEVVTVSIDPGETPELAREKKRQYLERYGRPEAARGWHFLTGEAGDIAGLAEAVGFHFAHDPETDLYAHPSGVVVLTPAGRVSHYFYGIDYPARDLRLSLVEASEETIGTAVDQLLLMCYHYDPRTGRYGLVILNGLRVAGLATLAALGGFVAVMLRRERRGRAG